MIETFHDTIATVQWSQAREGVAFTLKGESIDFRRPDVGARLRRPRNWITTYPMVSSNFRGVS